MYKSSKLLTGAVCCALACMVSVPVSASNVSDHNLLYDQNGARNARYDGDAQPIMSSLPLGNSGSKSVKTPTGGTLKSDVWIGAVDTSGSYDYQVAAKYDKTDHQCIKTMWYGEVYGRNVEFNIGTGGISIGSNTERKETERRYWENTKSQQDASFRTNGYLCGQWQSVDMYSTASVWGNSLGAKPTEVQAHTQRSR